MINIQQVLKEAIRLLQTNHSESARIDAEVLLAHTLKTTRTYLYTHPEMSLTAAQNNSFQELLNKRCAGHPIAYLIGSREFWSLKLHVDTSTLIPRPETELLVELTLKLLKADRSLSLLDLGTGSGAIALAIASERPNWQILACDINPDALTIAKKNANELALHNIEIIHSNWFTHFPNQQFHAIISNPPYLAENDPYLNQGDIRFEPQLALISGENGLESLTHLIKNGYDHLFDGGLLLLEHAYSQKESVTQLLQENSFVDVQSWQDIQGHYRVTGGWRR